LRFSIAVNSAREKAVVYRQLFPYFEARILFEGFSIQEEFLKKWLYRKLDF